MHRSTSKKPVNDYRPGFHWRGISICVFTLLVIAGFLKFRRHDDPAVQSAASTDSATSSSTGSISSVERPRRQANFDERTQRSEARLTADQIVARKVAQFGRKRRELVRAIARRSNKEVPAEIERFFDALEAGQWDEIKRQWHELAVHSGQYEYSKEKWEQLNPFWPAVLDAYGVAEQAHNWPAQKLLDYGNAVLDSLRPGMVYVGGTDPGRWIPELINDTADGDQHIMLTQNALADGRYIDFVNTLYSDRMQTLTTDDSQRAFQEYVTDAQKRLEHDQQFPDEPKQILPGENVQVVDGKVQVNGQVAVMAINERLLAGLMQKNPDMSFAIEESFPFKETYGDALPLGPLMQLNARNDQNAFTADQATQSLDYWRNMTQQVLSDFDASGSQDVLKTYSHDAVTAANLLAARSFTPEAEEAYRLAAQLWPASPESVGGLANLLAANGKQDEAQQLINNFVQKYPDQQKAVDGFAAGVKIISSTTPKP